jgi:HEAT repeat protein
LALSWFQPNVLKMREAGDAAGLVKALWKPDARAQAEAALVALGEDALPALVDALERNAPFPVLDAIVRVCVEIGPAAVEPLLALAAAARGRFSGRRRAIEALGRIGDARALSVLRELYDREAHHLKAAALGAIGEIDGDGYYDIALSALSERSHPVLLQAVETLGTLGDRRAAPALRALREEVEALDPARDGPERCAAILGTSPRVPRSARARTTMAAYQRQRLLHAIQGSLAKLGDAGATRALLDALAGDPSPSARSDAAEQLGRLGGDEAHAALRRALDDIDPGVRTSAEGALARMTAQGTVP